MATYFGEGTVISKEGDGYNFIPLTDWISTEGMEKIRAALEIRAAMSNISVRPAFMKANDKESPVAGDTITNTTALTADGISYGSNWDTITADLDGYTWVRFGAECDNTRGSGIHSCYAVLRVDVAKL